MLTVAPDRAKLLADLWKHGVPRRAQYSILEKLNIALMVAGKSLLNRSPAFTGDGKSLMLLRNALVHFRTGVV